MHDNTAGLSFRDYIKVGIECEIGMVLGDDLESTRPYTRENIARHVPSVCASIEIVDDRYVDYQALGILTTVADDFFNTAVVVGAPLYDWQRIDLEAITGTVRINGIEAGQGTGAMIFGHPFEALAWLANMKSETQVALRKGQFVTLGSVVKIIWIDEPDTLVEINFEGLEACSVRFTP